MWALAPFTICLHFLLYLPFSCNFLTPGIFHIFPPYFQRLALHVIVIIWLDKTWLNILSDWIRSAQQSHLCLTLYQNNFKLILTIDLLIILKKKLLPWLTLWKEFLIIWFSMLAINQGLASQVCMDPYLPGVDYNYHLDSFAFLLITN